MDADQLKLLLRQRAEALAPDAAVLDRALARCARIGLRRSAASGRQGSSSLVTVAATVVSQTPAASAQLQPVTIPSLSAAPAEAVPAGQLAPGRIIAGYRIEGLLGKGGMGSVYRATQLSMNRPVAFKVLAPRLAGDPAFVGRFRREARAAGRLHHPNLVTVHDSGEADGLVFFSMELVEGRSLKAVIKERGRLPADEALRLTRQALEALAYAHGKGVVHRDIKPDNLMLMANGQIKVADLGLSRIDEGGDGGATNLFETSAGSFMGSPHYMAPEQGRDAHSADQRSDLYSVGATLYHLVCGQPPFSGATAMEVLIAAQEHPLAWPAAAPPPAPLRELIARLLEKDPARRPPDAQAAIAVLDHLLTPQGGSQPVPPRRSWRGALLTAAILAITTLALLFAFERVRENARERSWREALAAAERRPESQSRGQFDDLRERRAEAWRKVRADPPESMQLRDGVALFRGSGRGRLPTAGPGHALRLAWRGTAPDDATWRLSVGGVEFVLRADAAELAGQPLVRSEDGTFGVALVRRIDGLVLMARGRNGPLFQQVTGEPALSWSLGAGEVEATLGRK